MHAVRGQAALEAALVLPLFLFFVLALVQLAWMQQARLLTGYAAFQAARAGSVWSGNHERMRHAAAWAIAPSAGPATGLETLARTRERLGVRDAWLSSQPWPGPRALNGSPLRGLVEVTTESPTPVELSERGAPDDWAELDFDEPAFGDCALGVQVRYWFPLRVPWVNAWFFAAWYAARSAVGGATDAEREELRVLWAIAHRPSTPEDVRYLIPLSARYRMQMQSNFYRKWLP